MLVYSDGRNIKAIRNCLHSIFNYTDLPGVGRMNASKTVAKRRAESCMVALRRSSQSCTCLHCRLRTRKTRSRSQRCKFANILIALCAQQRQPHPLVQLWYVTYTVRVRTLTHFLAKMNVFLILIIIVADLRSCLSRCGHVSGDILYCIHEGIELKPLSS